MKAKPTTLLVPLACLAFSACGQTGGYSSVGNAPGQPGKAALQALTFTTAAYRREALRLLIEEASRVAGDLHLAEPLPIGQTNLTAVYISPPRLAQSMGTFGNISTSNYTYYISIDRKFSFLVRKGLEQEREKMRSEYLWSTNEISTNAAIREAERILNSACMDAAALNRDCEVRVKPYRPKGTAVDRFVPIYWVYWVKRSRQDGRPEAEVEVCVPTRAVHQLHVMRSEYIQRKPVAVGDLARLLADTNGVPAQTR